MYVDWLGRAAGFVNPVGQGLLSVFSWAAWLNRNGYRPGTFVKEGGEGEPAAKFTWSG